MNYSDLVTSIQNWAARSEAETVAEIPNFILFAEGSFNHGMPDRSISPLRVREMQATATIPLTSGSGPLPTDYLQYITARSMTSTPNPLSYASGAYTDYAFPDSAAGMSNTFNITGVSTINVFPSSGSDVQFTYYQQIPPLSDANPTNWLLTKMPALYLHGALMHLGIFTKDNDLIQRSQALVSGMIDGLNLTDTIGTYAATGTRLRMVTP